MGAEENSAAILDVVKQPLTALTLVNWIEVCKWFVQEKQLGFVNKGRSKHDLLALSLREIFAHGVSLFVQTKPIKPVFNFVFNVFNTAQSSHEFEEFSWREEGGWGFRFRNNSDVRFDFLRVCHRVHSEHLDLPFARSQLPC